MTKQEFIFSNKFFHRLSRHVIFWISWAIAYNLFFHYPIHVLKGWSLNSPPTANLQKLGPGLFFLKTFFVNSIVAVITPQILFTYLFIFRIAPRMMMKEFSLMFKLFVTVFSVLVFFLTASLFKYAPPIYNILTGINDELPEYGSIWRSSFIDQISTIPLVLGSALTINFFKKSYHNQKKAEQLLKENLYAELQLLKAQIHPHFLFNTINNIYFHTLTLSNHAPDLIRKLSDMMRYFLTECNQPQVSLQNELDSLTDYLTLEKIRYGDKLCMEVNFPENAGNYRIAPMLLIPFIENSFKHGASLSLESFVINLDVEVKNHWLIFRLRNDIPDNPGIQRTKGNIGLNNVQKRLELLYPDAHILNITVTSAEYCVDLMIDLQNLKLPDQEIDIKKAETNAMV